MFKKIAGVLVAVSPAAAFAAVPAPVTTALADAQTDGVTIATSVFVAVVAMFAFKLMRRGL
ncbi:major capsid protein [Thiobacillus sp.]|uniref:major capsid protein n=1 Tax=Thiobacillus sp. TaxID=924 RepID=UPI00286D765C|nr:major capsid protein [Thiobacillus sp.]